MTVEQWLPVATRRLKDAGIGSARLDSLILLEDATRHNRAWLLAHPEYGLENEIVHSLDNRLTRREQHIPLAYIRGHSEFYGRDFILNEHVLVPRPESEDIIGSLCALPLRDGATIIDVGTGSGCLAVTAALELPAAHVVATDIDARCLDVGRRNAEAHHVEDRVHFIQANLLQPQSEGRQPLATADVILANLPYVPDGYPINQAAGHEPQLALFAGTDGLDAFRSLFAQIAAAYVSVPYLTLICESLMEQHDALISLAAEHGYMLQDHQGLIQTFIKKQ